MSDQGFHPQTRTEIPYATPYTQPPESAAPPTAPAAPAMLYATTAAGVWRHKKYLVMHRTAQLPDLCVKSGEHAEGYRLKRRLYWHHPAIFLVFLTGIPAGLVIYVVVALIVRKTAVVNIGLSKRYHRRRRNTILLGWLGCLGSVGLGVYLFDRGEFVWVTLSIAAFLASLVVAKLMSQMVSPRRIDREYVWLRGVSPKFLGMFPEWPYAAR